MFVHGHLQGLRRNFIRIYRWRPRIKTIPRDILPSSLVSKDELKAIIAPEAIPTAAPASLRFEGEVSPESHHAHLVAGIKLES